MRPNRPKVFVSSTIYDFRDLRSAIKMWLEEYGYEVLMSEFNDFPQCPEVNSYESCLNAIDQSDYFLLFIGGRVGGWYDKNEKISITRQEYRYAYERFKTGHLKLLVFVRKEIWDIREDRQALQRFLDEDATLARELPSTTKSMLVNHPSKFLTDAEHILSFLKEVGRVEEMTSPGNNPLPRGNWIYQFSSFRDIVDACRTVLDLSGNLRQKALKANLKHELISILAELLVQTDTHAMPVTAMSQHARACFKGKAAESSTYDKQDLRGLGKFLLMQHNVKTRLKTTALKEAIASGEMLDFDKTTGSHTVGPLQEALLQLDTEIDRLDRIPIDELLGTAMGWLKSDHNAPHPTKTASYINLILVPAFLLHDRIENIISLCRAIYHAINEDKRYLQETNLMPDYPLPDESIQSESTRATRDDVHRWLSTAKPK